jgi:hypothetical protein
VDGLLRAYFRAEVPRPWPALTLPALDGRAPSSPPAQPPRFRLHGRLSLAAAVALFVTGYASLASRFPAAPSAPGVAVEVKQFGGEARRHKLPRSGRAVERTRSGAEAQIQWEELPGGLFMRIEEKRPPRR